MLNTDDAYIAIIGNAQDKKIQLIECRFHSEVKYHRLPLLKFAFMTACSKSKLSITRNLYFHEDALHEIISSTSALLCEPESLQSQFVIHNKVFVSLVANSSDSSEIAKRISQLNNVMANLSSNYSAAKSPSALKSI